MGLFGAGIGRSQAPRLHKLAARLCGLQLSYELFDLNDLGLDGFEEKLEQTARQGLTGVNVTHPVKERAASLFTVPDIAMRQIGAVNTVRFADKTAYNTDYSGFIRAFQQQFATVSPGKVLMFGAGGVGKAIGFALTKLKASMIYLTDTDAAKAEKLVAELKAAGAKCDVQPLDKVLELAEVDGLINCTPLGMYQYPGSAIPKEMIGGQRWAFDAVYTPLETQFLKDAKERGLELLSGYELFFYQGVDAFKLFTGLSVDEEELRRQLVATVN